MLFDYFAKGHPPHECLLPVKPLDSVGWPALCSFCRACCFSLAVTCVLYNGQMCIFSTFFADVTDNQIQEQRSNTTLLRICSSLLRVFLGGEMVTEKANKEQVEWCNSRNVRMCSAGSLSQTGFRCDDPKGWFTCMMQHKHSIKAQVKYV